MTDADLRRYARRELEEANARERRAEDAAAANPTAETRAALEEARQDARDAFAEWSLNR